VLPAARIPSVTAGVEEQGWHRNDWEQGDDERTEEPELPVKERLWGHTGPQPVHHQGAEGHRGLRIDWE